MDELPLVPKYPVSRHIGFNVDRGKAILLDDYCTLMQRKRGDLLREMLDEWMKAKGILR